MRTVNPFTYMKGACSAKMWQLEVIAGKDFFEIDAQLDNRFWRAIDYQNIKELKKLDDELTTLLTEATKGQKL